MGNVTPRTTLPANGVTTDAVQITGTALRVSARSTAGEVTLCLIRMNATGDWFRVTNAIGEQVEMNLAKGEQGNTDYSFTLPAEGASEWYHLLLDGGSDFEGDAEINSLSAPPAAGGTVPAGRNLTTSGGVTGGGDLSADRSFSLGGTDDQVLSTGALTWLGAAGKASTVRAGTGAALTLGANGVAVASIDSGGAGLVLAANKNLSCAAGTTAVDLSLGTGEMKPPSGLFTFQGKQAAATNANRIADPGNGGAIPVTSDGHVPMTSAGAETRTLAIPTYVGQRASLICDVYIGDIVVTSAQALNQTGNTVMTFGAAGDMIVLEGMQLAGALRWRVISNDGVALS